jgi:hypothetical protein
MTDKPHSSDEHPILFASGAGGLIGFLLIAIVFWDWRWLVVSVVAFIGSAVIAVILDNTRKDRSV